MNDLARILADQREARDWLVEYPGYRGAKLGLADAVGEEILMREEEAQ